MNFGEVRGGGLSLSLTHSCSLAGLSVNSLVTYSFEKATDRSDPGNIGYGGQSVSLLCSGKRYSASDNNRETLLKGWSTVDLNLSRKIVDIGKSRLKGIVSLTNLLCARYEIVRRYPMPGTGASIGISLEM